MPDQTCRLVGSYENWWPALLWTQSISSMRISPLLQRYIFRELHARCTCSETMSGTALLCQVTSNMARSTEYPMPTQGEFFPKRSLSGKEEVCYSNELWSLSLLPGGKAYGDKWGKRCAGNEVLFKNPSWLYDFSLYVQRYADNGEIAAIIKHKVEDGKMSVILECGDIVCNSTYVKIWWKKSEALL